MNKIQIILHCLPREIDEVERICNHLHRASHFLEKGDDVILDFTLNISDTLTDWSNSKIPKQFFVEKWKMIEQRSDWTFKNIFEISIPTAITVLIKIIHINPSCKFFAILSITYLY